ncbi:lipopolysaccharide biosynthesis protein [Aquabacterium sp.]|uniref:lipopolysaccharide biosynthesis protein n=1 Tax=Aquabacterium sp. TaxID=1872578 RepID=UPI002E30D235|nr:oligosaccharide flippase family protein [Aquabacterium sp.]HEX5311182.1 oligosaccharide flippase family protein [Aquabacterium sp.]
MTAASSNQAVAKNFAFYALSNVLVLAAGFISFPITTRLLSNTEFGLLSFWESGLLVLVAILKLGASDGAMRFYPHRGDARDMQRYATNILFAPALFGLAGWAVALLSALVLWAVSWLEHPGVVFLALAQVLPLAWGALAFRVLQARELAAVNATLSVVWRWLTLASTLGVLIWVTQTAFGVLAGKLLIHILVIGGLLVWVLPSLPFSRQAWDWKHIQEGLHYGLPLALMELSNIALWYVDRFMLKWLIDDFAVIGIYSVGFALASYIDQLINTALSQALTPVATRVFATEGPAAVRAVKQRVLRPLVFICFALSTGLVIGGADFLTLLASKDKADAAPVFIFAGVVMLMKAIIWAAAEGLLLHKRSKTVFVLTIVSALVNALANLILIPHFGMMGAVYATGISLLGLQLLFFAFCPKELRAWPQLSVIAKAGAAAALCLLLAHETALFGLVNHFARLGATAVLVGMFFSLAMLTDPQMRSAAATLWHKLDKKRAA